MSKKIDTIPPMQPSFITTAPEEIIGHNNILIGINPKCIYDNCILIGNNLTATRDNQIIIGNKEVTISGDIDIETVNTLITILKNTQQTLKS